MRSHAETFHFSYRHLGAPGFITRPFGLTHIAPWGELLSTRVQVLKAGGFVTDGSVRDARMIHAIGFPVVCSGTTPVDTKYRGKLALSDVPGRFGGVDIASGDLVFADEDGMVVVPAARILTIVGEALSKMRAEKTVRNELAAGETLRDIFTHHRIP